MPAYFGFKKIAISILFISFFITNPFWGICQSGNNLDSLLNQLQNTNNPYERILLLNSIANKLSATNNDTAVHLCYEGLNLSQKTGNDSLIAVCYTCLINAYFQKAYHEDSAIHFIPFFKKYIEGKNWYKLEYSGYLAIAEVYLKKHDWPQSTIYFQIGMEAALKTNDPEVIGYAKFKLAEMYRKSGSCADAMSLNFELVEEGKKSGNAVNMYYGYRGIAICYDIKQEYDSAEKYFSLALEAARQTKSQKRIAIALSNVGVVTWHVKKYDKSIVVSKNAVEILAGLNDEQIIPAYQNLCCVYRDMGMLDSAEYFCKLGLDEATRRNQVFSVSILNGITSDVFKRKGDYKLAMEY
ncbi:MAG: tetratricopeptide repeat protein [Bacteroidetes bacterium]|nr:tetratricopeptide repeat protein [Bacteroidota bacterium]